MFQVFRGEPNAQFVDSDADNYLMHYAEWDPGVRGTGS